MKKSTFVRRLSAWMMAAVMLLSMVPATAAFRDTAGHWAEKTLTEWQDKGLIDGYGDGSFQPDGTMTRAEFAKMVNRMLGFTAESAISFSDVTERDWFYAEVARAAAAGYAQGSGGMFRPNQAVTRAEAAAMLARALDLAANEERADAFADASSIPAWARGSVGAVAESGYMNGYPDGTFGASDSITRAEAVVTLDRVLKSAKETVIEAAGTTLENETIPGDLVIAESVGNGNVTLKNVTVLGSVIVKGGGANSIYFDGVRVNGAVRLQKENVHLRLMGDTALERVEIGLPCRVTQDSTFKGSLGTLVIDLEKTSNQKIQIEVPAKLVELLSRANVALHADVETLQIDKDAEGAQLDIKRGVTVGELSIDARVALTGSGLVVSLVVSVSGVTVSGTLTVKKTETEGGAKAPTTSGGSSGGGVTLKEIESIAPITAEVPYGTNETGALAALPEEITLNVKDGSTVKAAAAGWSWASYNGTTAGNYTATTSFTVPSGYTYSGTLTAEAAVTVKALNTNAFDVALTAAQTLKNGLTDSEAAAATDDTKILITDKAADAITNGVRFTTEDEKSKLQGVITAAETAKLKGFTSQQACDDQTKALTDAVAAFTKTIGTGTSKTTNAYLLRAVQNGNAINPKYSSAFAYSTEMQPLRNSYTYWLYGDRWTVPGSGVTVSFDWSFSGAGAQYLALAPDGGHDHKNNLHSYGVKVTGQPDEPAAVTLTATVTRYDLDPNGTEVGRIDYTATVGAPIQVNASAPVTAPRLTSGNKENNISVQVPLTGAEYITGVDTSRITAEENTTITAEVPLATSKVSITEGKSCTVNNSSGLSVPVTASCGFMGVTLAPVSPVDPAVDPAYKIGNIPVTIRKGALKVDESSGWYAPDEDLTYAAVVWGCNPTVTVLTQPAEGYLYTVSVSMAYMYEIRAIEVVYKTSDGSPTDAEDEVHVSFSKDDGKTDTSVQDGIVYKGKNVTLTPGAYHIWVSVENTGTWLRTGESFTVGGEDTQ